MITGRNESNILTKNISCECKYRFDGRKCISDHGGITIKVIVSVKSVMYVKKMIVKKVNMQLRKWKMFRKYY